MMHSTLFTGAFFILLTVVFTTPAVSQDRPATAFPQQRNYGDSSTVGKTAPIESLDAQLVSLLESEDPERQNTAMTIIINFRRQRPDAYDFTACIPPLLQLYRSDQSEGMRLLALAALDAIGTPKAYEALRQSVGKVRSRRVRRQTALVLHYAEKDGRAS